ncbi:MULTISPECIES: hypothetical protein [Citromicrobium]|uniref:hypothetical protein n=1 Tax=Citromicrobium TaxID=72173 RepID=UPI0001DD0D3A|nr:MULTISPECIES: hypothetical protein [Citromicrobium]ALG61804.1 hypothetical protein WG74_13975 [Citromicrobium sp. JL477]
METEVTKIAPEQLLLDPNNYRFLDIPGYRKVAKRERYGEDGVQAKALDLLTSHQGFDLESLRDSIASNGFVPLDQLVVEEFDEQDDRKRYLVIEGNRRAAAVKTLLRDQEDGSVDLSDEVKSSLGALPVIIVSGEKKEKDNFHKTLMAIRHVSGIREWGAYQQAKLVVEMYEDEAESLSQVAKQIGISPQEVGRRYRASKALNQMESDDEFGVHASPKLYSFFHETVSSPQLREWLDFSNDTYTAQNDESRTLFYQLLSPSEVDGEKYDPKLQNANRQIRQLKQIVESDAALALLSDPEKSFDEAVKVSDDEAETDQSGATEYALKQALKGLRKPGIDAWNDPTDRTKELWAELRAVFDAIDKVLEDDE